MSRPRDPGPLLLTILFVTNAVIKVWYKSKDGTPIPMFIVRHKSTQFDGKAPALQYGEFDTQAQPLHLLTLCPCQPRTGYGGFSISIDPFFSSTILTFIQKYGMIFAVPSIRGGGEFGEDWHLAGCREKKVCLSRWKLDLSMINRLVLTRKIALTISSPPRTVKFDYHRASISPPSVNSW